MAAEALSRWTDDELGEVSPGEFIPVAEEAGLIACARGGGPAAGVRGGAGVAGRGFRGDPGHRERVVRQLWQREIVGSVERVLAETGLPPSALELELTESVLLRRTEDVSGLLAELRRLGVRLSIDDFGTGYSSLRIPEEAAARHPQGGAGVRPGPVGRPERRRHRARGPVPRPHPRVPGGRGRGRDGGAPRVLPVPRVRPGAGIPSFARRSCRGVRPAPRGRTPRAGNAVGLKRGGLAASPS